MKDNHWSVIDNCLIYTGLDFVAFVEPSNKTDLVRWQVRITKGDGSEDKSVIINYYYYTLGSAVEYVERFFDLSITEQREQFGMESKLS